MSWKPGDWKCVCDWHNFRSRDTCKNCGRPKRDAVGASGSSRHGDSRPSAAPAGAGATFKPGDWNCPKCGAHNFRSRPRCLKCGGNALPGRDADADARPSAAASPRYAPYVPAYVGPSQSSPPPPPLAQPPSAASAPAPSERSAADAVTCAICIERPRDVCAVPCGHVFCCSACSATLQTCAICRAELAGFNRVIIA